MDTKSIFKQIQSVCRYRKEMDGVGTICLYRAVHGDKEYFCENNRKGCHVYYSIVRSIRKNIKRRENKLSK